MAVSTPQQPGKGRSLDAEIILVPFIDLLSMCICFLLITAVWIQIGSVEIKQSHGTEASAAAETKPELVLAFPAAGKIALTVKQNGRVTKKHEFKSSDFTGALGLLDQGLTTMGLTSAGSGFITPSTHLNYGDLVRVMDVLRKKKITNLGVLPNASPSEGV